MGVDVLWPNPMQSYVICTSSTRPASAEGLLIYETDTNRMYLHDGLGWKYITGGTNPTATRAYRNAAFSLTVSASVFTLIPFDTEIYDYGNNFATGTGRYTCPEEGTYAVDGRVSMANTASGERFVGGIFKNASEEWRGTDIHSLGSIRVSVQAHGHLLCSAGDILDFRVQQTAGTARAVDVGVTFHSIFQVSRI